MKRFTAIFHSNSTIVADLLAASLLLLLTLVFFWRTISGDVYQPADGGDLVSLLFPTYRFAAAQLSQGVIPLWNPHLRAGAPFISDIQSGFLYPPNLLLFLLNPQFGYKWMQWLSIAHIYWAGLGMYLLLRRGLGGKAACGVRNAEGQATPIPHSVLRTPHSALAAIFAALAFQFSDALFIHLGNLNLIAVLSWLPWVMLAFVRALNLRSLGWAALAGLLFAIGNFAGHAQSSLYIGFALISYWLLGSRDWRLEIGDWEIEAKQSPISNLQSLISTARYLLITFLITLLLNAPILLPAIEMTAYSERANFNYQATIAYSLDPVQAVVGILSPGFFGRGPALHWTLWDRVETPYVGVSALLLAVTALALTRRQRQRSLLPWLGLAVIGLLIALGVYGILHGLLYWILPGFSQFRGPARAIVLWAFGISVLAGVGVDRVVGRWGDEGNAECAMRNAESTSPATRNSQFAIFTILKWGGLFLALVLTPLIYATLLVTQSDPVAFLRASLAALALLLATGMWLATWGVLAARRAGWLSGSLAALGLIALLFLDFTATGAYTDISSSDPTKGFQHPTVIDFLKADPDLFRIDTRTSLDPGFDCIWQPNTAALVGLQDVCSDPNPLTLTAWKKLWEATGGRDTARYDRLNIKYVIVRDGTPLPGEGKFELAFDAPDELSIYRNRNFVPRAWLTIDAVDGLPDGALPAVTISHYGANEITLHVATAQPQTLILSELWYPGWRATVNDVTTEVKSTADGLRTIQTVAGENVVRLWFAPRSWQIGLIAALGGLILVGVCMRRLGTRA